MEYKDSKSFLSTLVIILRCILYPGSHLFVTSGGKEQSAGIIKEKVQELCQLVPAFKREINWDRGQTTEGKDYCCYRFNNGSWFDNLSASEKTRGKRRHSGVLEECVGIDGKVLNEVIIPVMNIDRRAASGEVVPDEPLNKSQIYLTTAGEKGTFSYDKLITLLVRMVTEPEKAIIMGGTYKIPVLMGLLNAGFVQDLKRDGTFNEASFGREYESVWSGTSQNAFFDGEAFDRCRKLNQPEYEYSGRSTPTAYYVIGADIGRKGCDSVAAIVKVTPQSTGPAIKSLVNIEVMENTHFEEQALWLKRLYYKYKARMLVIDANGVGLGLVDYMIKPQTWNLTGETFVDFGVANDEEGYYKKYRTPDTELDAMYLIKANAPLNTEAHVNIQSQMNSGKLRFLIDERQAKAKLLQTKIGQAMSPEGRGDYLRPFNLTSVLRTEMLNLKEETEGININLKRSNKQYGKDKFSALEYALYYIKQEEDSKKKRKKFNVKDFMFMS